MADIETHDEIGATRARRLALKPLTGLNILLVDDSRSVSEAIRMMAIHSGARIRRADCLASAAKHLMIYNPDILIVDLGLPDGNGVELARKIVEQGEERPAVLVMSAADEAVTAAAAASAGADGYLLKPVDRIADFQSAILGLMGVQSLAHNTVASDTVSLDSDPVIQDLENVYDLLGEAIEEKNRVALAFCAQFLSGVARTIGDEDLSDQAAAVTDELQAGGDGTGQARTARSAVEARLNGGISISA